MHTFLLKVPEIKQKDGSVGGGMESASWCVSPGRGDARPGPRFKITRGIPNVAFWSETWMSGKRKKGAILGRKKLLTPELENVNL